MTGIVERIEREAGVPGLVSILAERLAPTDLQSLLLEVYRVRASERSPADVLQGYESDRFVQPSSVSPKKILEWDRIAYSHLPQEFDPIALSPLCPLGTNSVVASVDQNWAISTSRNTEVVSDSSNVLALECALRRRELLRSDPKSNAQVHLAASHRLVRAQKYEGSQFSSHFSAFVLCSAGRDEGNFGFELSAIDTQIRFYVRSLRSFLGPEVPLIVTFTDFDRKFTPENLEARFLSAVQADFDFVESRVDNQRRRGQGYYTDFAFQLHAVPDSGEELELIDGGSVDWTQKYLSNAKERLVISGLGTERLCQEF